MRLLWIFLCVVSLLLAGCGGGAGTESPGTDNGTSGSGASENGPSESGSAGDEGSGGESSGDAGSSDGSGRSCQEVPESGDPGDSGTGLNVTILLTIPDGTEMTLDFPVGDPCHTWEREADPDEHDSEPHQHYNAADRTAFLDGTFRWTEYGPEHSQEDIDKRCAADDRGTTKYATLTDSCEDHNGILIRVSDVGNS